MSIKKNEHIIRVFFLSFFIFIFFPHQALSKKISGLSLELGSRYAIQVEAPYKTTSHRYSLQLQKDTQWSDKTFTRLGFRTSNESAYAREPELYQGEIQKTDTFRFFPSDIYIQHRSGPWRLTVGNQVVIWGEAFGQHFADIVNPKDLREGGLGRLSDNRIHHPIVNFQWLDSSKSIQLIIVPISRFNEMPASGSLFLSWIDQIPGNTHVIIERPQLVATDGEFGLRLRNRIFNTDLSLFFFYYMDRAPYYIIEINSSDSIKLRPQKNTIWSSGLTFSKDFGSNVLRGELVYHDQRRINSLIEDTFSHQKTNEILYVIGFDFRPVNNWFPSIQASQSLYTEDADFIFRNKSLSMVSLRFARIFTNGREVELTTTYEIERNSYLFQTQWTEPVLSNLEASIGLDFFTGHDNSTLGQMRNGSRIFFKFRSYL